MLLYHPAFDFHHSLFRLLLLVEGLEGKSIEPERLRIFDFYFLFPHEITFIRVAKLQVPLKLKFSNYPQYEAISNPAKVFYRLEPVFENSLKTLVAAGILVSETKKKASVVYRSAFAVPKALEVALANRKQESADVIQFLTSELYPFPLQGPDGLKARTNLLPSKNDRR